MELYYSIRPLLAVLVSLCAVPFIVLSPRPNIRETVSFIAAGLKFALVISMLPVILNGHQIIFTLMNVLPGAPIQFRVDALGMLFGIVSSFLWIVTTTYSIGYMRGLDEHAQTRYFCFFAIALSATIGVAFAANLLTLYLFYEILSLATYPLVTHHQDDEARISGRKYLTYILGTSIGFVLPAMLYVYHVTGTLNFSALGILGKAAPHSVLIVILFLFIFGFAKSAIMPFHAWLPAAMVAPTPVSALLHAVAVVKVGVFSIIRVLLYTFGTKELMGLHVGPAVSYVASFTIIIGSLIALSQDNLKRLLAYSTISQLSYIILGVALLSPRGMTGGLIHIPMHAFGKITLFFCAGAIFVATGKKNLSEMHGIGKRMPITMIAFFIASLSIIGLPPCGGFLSKWNLLLGSLQSHQAIALVVLLVSSLLNAAYFMPIIYKAFFLRDQGSAQGIREAPLFCVVPLCVTSLLSIAMFFYPQPFYKLIKLVIHQLLRA
ncbi:MAG: monovalent cation/H+ antiporter subunit D family protein [Deltaproteobacteria bacterium]|nr:monovalent cation/H+ antiporter subunit D family protein [Deltaproteobacteria bacterium]MBW1929750.1 monovalent cation/H+ antiporter subunit D family protein [Deltaproteobacteria bacterium]MBW2124495.1 monovalent cation/H+ antiporter subunit D family protein [Deltaproteobacteria bacterium]